MRLASVHRTAWGAIRIAGQHNATLEKMHLQSAAELVRRIGHHGPGGIIFSNEIGARGAQACRIRNSGYPTKHLLEQPMRKNSGEGWHGHNGGAWDAPAGPDSGTPREATVETGDDRPGVRLRAALGAEQPLQVAGTINAYFALLAERAGFKALYLSGAGVANASWGLPDLGMTSLADVLEDARRITGVTELPLLVDADTGWGEAFGIARTVRELTRAGVAGMHLEDQVAQKRCGHRPGKVLVGAGEMTDRVKAAVDARPDPGFVVMARTDALAVEGLEAAVERAVRYVEAGADMVFAEAVTDLRQY